MERSTLRNSYTNKNKKPSVSIDESRFLTPPIFQSLLISLRGADNPRGAWLRAEEAAEVGQQSRRGGAMLPVVLLLVSREVHKVHQQECLHPGGNGPDSVCQDISIKYNPSCHAIPAEFKLRPPASVPCAPTRVSFSSDPYGKSAARWRSSARRSAGLPRTPFGLSLETSPASAP